MRTTLAHAAGWRAVNVLSSVAANLIALRLCAKFLPEGVFGAVTIAFIVLSYLPLLDGGFRMAINRELLIRGPLGDQRSIVEFGQTLYGFLSLAAAMVSLSILALYSLTPRARGLGLSPQFFLAIGLAGAVTFAAQSQANLLIGLGQQWKVFALNCLSAWLNVAALWFGFRQGWVAWAFPFAVSVAAIVMGILGWTFARGSIPGLRILGSGLGPSFRSHFQQLKGSSFAALRNQVYTTALYSLDPVLAFFLCASASEGDTYVLVFRVMVIVRSLLQSADEAFWPRVAADRDRGIQLSMMLCRSNAWLYGAALGSLLVTLPMFVSSYVGRADWIPSFLLVALMAARGLVTGLCSQPAYFLYGDGQFHRLATGMGREVLCAVLLAVPLGWYFGSNGTAAGFLLATSMGTLAPIPKVYVATIGKSLSRWLGSVWSRALIAAVLASVVGLALRNLGNGTLWVVGVAITASTTGILGAVFYSLRFGAKLEGGWREFMRRI